MKIQVQIPDYFTIKHYKALNQVTSLDELQNMVNTIVSLTEHKSEEVMQWEFHSVLNVYNALNDMIKGINPEFYPVIEWNGKLWGFSPMSKMKLGEYIDIDTLSKDPDKNINQVLALLYRPIVKNDIPSLKFTAKSTLKALKYDVENVFDYYELEAYDPVLRKQRAGEFDEFPFEIAMGAMTFFLDTKAMLLSGSQLYSLKEIHQKIAETMKITNKIKRRLLNITAGYLRLRNYQKPPSYQSQEIKHLQTSM